MYPISPATNLRRQRGLTLVELMVAMLIGLVLLAAVGTIFLSSKSAFISSDQRGRVHESGRLTADVVGAMTRQAGYVDIANTTSPDYQAIVFDDVAKRATTGIIPVFACRGGRINFTTVPWSCTANAVVPGVPPSDSIAFSYQSQPANALVQGSTLLPFGGGFGGDCNGNNPMPSTAMGASTMPVDTPIAINEYYVARNIATTQGGSTVYIPELYCRGNGAPGTAQPFAQGVEQLRVRFAVTDAFSWNPKLWETDADGVSSSDWDKVQAVEICAVTLSPARTQGSGLSTTAQVYKDCDGVDQTPADTRLRKATYFRFNLRNRTNTASSIIF